MTTLLLALAAMSFSGTWFGKITLTSNDGKISHDTAVMVLQQSGAKIAGSIGRTVDEQTALSGGHVEGHTGRFHLDAAGGLDFQLVLDGRRISGKATGPRMKAEVALRPAPGLLPHQQLLEEITAADQALFDAFQACDVPRYGESLSKDVEFYQDHTGKTGYAENLAALRQRCEEGIHLRRELVDSTLIVNAAPGFGAIESGTHRFYSRQPDGSEHLDATAQFTNVWTKATGTWKLIRIVSFDHR
jgi:ketosteroid isomerase-like protein